MKKLVALFAALLLALPLNALALTPTPTPEPASESSASPEPTFEAVETPAPDAQAVDNALLLEMEGTMLSMAYDPSPSYTRVEHGCLQASFFAEVDGTLYELYLIFPVRVAAGDVVDPERCARVGDEVSGIMLFVTSDDADIMSMATQDRFGAFPEGASYAITFEGVEAAEGGTSFLGSFTGTLADVDRDYNALDQRRSLSGSFRFTADLSDREGASPLPSADAGLPTPPPTLTVPADAHKI